MKKNKLFSLFSFLVIIFISSACTTITEVEQSKDDSKNNQENKVDVDVNINTCFSDDDCVQSVFCGCHTLKYINTKIEEANKAGIMYDACTHPPDSYCVCRNNECVQLIDKEARKEKAEQFTINNSEINNIPNLIVYKQEDVLNAEIDFDDVYIFSWPISVNQEILTNEDIDIINVNLPSNINILLERIEYTQSQYTSGIFSWKGQIISDDDKFNKGDTVRISVSEDGILFTIMSYQIKNNNYSYTITNNSIRVRER